MNELDPSAPEDSPLPTSVTPAMLDALRRYQTGGGALGTGIADALNPVPALRDIYHGLTTTEPSEMDQTRSTGAMMSGTLGLIGPLGAKGAVAIPTAAGAIRRAAPRLADVAADSFRSALPRELPQDHTETLIAAIRDALEGDWDHSVNMPRPGSNWQQVPAGSEHFNLPSLDDKSIEAALAANPGMSLEDLAGVSSPSVSTPTSRSSGRSGPLNGTALGNAIYATHIKPHFDESDFANEYFAGMHDPNHIEMNHANPLPERHDSGVGFYGNLTVGGNKIGIIQRSIYPDSGTAYHDYLKIDPDLQSSGIAKSLLAKQVGVYQKMGLNNVELTANINVGGYAWAKYGFLPSQEDWNLVRSQASRKLAGIAGMAVDPEVRDGITSILKSSDPKSIWALADIKAPVGGVLIGKRLLMDTGWHGSLDLKDPSSLERFNAYTRSK